MSDALKQRLARLKETDPETADLFEAHAQAQGEHLAQYDGRFQNLEQRLAATEQTGQARHSQADAQHRLDAVMPGLPWREYTGVDENGAYTNAAFAKFVNEQPMGKVREFWDTDDPNAAAGFIRSFHATLEGGGTGKEADPPPNGGASAGQPGSNGATRTEPSATDARRTLQRQAGTGIPGGKAAPTDEPPGDSNTFEAGWKQADAEHAARMKRHASHRNARQPAVGMPGY